MMALDRKDMNMNPQRCGNCLRKYEDKPSCQKCGSITCDPCYEEEKGCYRCGYKEGKVRGVPIDELCDKCESTNVRSLGGAIFKFMFGVNVYECQDCDSAWFYGTDSQAKNLVNTVIIGKYDNKMVD